MERATTERDNVENQDHIINTGCLCNTSMKKNVSWQLSEIETDFQIRLRMWTALWKWMSLKLISVALFYFIFQ